MGKYDQIIFIDTEVSMTKEKAMDYGAVSRNGLRFHGGSRHEFAEKLKGFRYICGHNIFQHDLKYMQEEMEGSQFEGTIDTLYLSPLLFPNKPYHALLKDDKLQADELNNPLNDAQKCKPL